MVEANKVYWGLWVALGIFWVIGFAYYSAKLDNTIYPGRPFYAELMDAFPDSGSKNAVETTRAFPAFLLCPGDSSSDGLKPDILNPQCQFCKRSEDDGSCADVKMVQGKLDPTNHTNCYLYNGNASTAVHEYGPGYSLDCTFALGNTTKSRLYILDTKWYKNYMNDKRIPKFPNGIVQRTMVDGSRNIVEIARSKYIFSDNTWEYSFQMLDGESYPDKPAEVSLMMFYGTLSEWTYTQSKKKITTKYDFWYWVGFLGGFSFLIYMLHTAFYGVVAYAMGWGPDAYKANYQALS
jgi:hypothetical protein